MDICARIDVEQMIYGIRCRDIVCKEKTMLSGTEKQNK
jgi:hypothetical protein